MFNGTFSAQLEEPARLHAKRCLWQGERMNPVKSLKVLLDRGARENDVLEPEG